MPSMDVSVRAGNYFVIGFLLLVSSLAVAKKRRHEVGRPLITNYTAEELGVHPQIFCATQNKQGLMYFCYENGLLEYDGIQWRKIDIRERGNVCSATFGDEGRLYVGAALDFGYLEWDSRGAVSYTSLSTHLAPEHAKENDFCGVHATRHGVYFVNQHVILRWWKGHLSLFSNLAEDKLKCSSVSIGDRVVFRTMEGGLAGIEDGKLVPLGEPGLLDSTVMGRISFVRENEQRLLIFTEKDGVHLFDLRSNKLTRKIGGSELTRYLGTYSFQSGIVLKNAELALVTSTNGILISTPAGEIVQFVKRDSGAVSDLVYQLFEDREGNVWATTANGIYRIDVRHGLTLFGMENGLKENVVKIIRHNDLLYLGCLDGLYVLRTSENEKSGEFSNRIVKVKHVTGSSVDFIQNDHVLIATGGAHLYAVDKSAAVPLFDSSVKLYPEALGRSKKFDQYIFVGTYGCGLAAIKFERAFDQVNQQDLLEKRFTLEREDFLDTVRDNVLTINEDRLGNLWILTHSDSIVEIRFTGDTPGEHNVIRYPLDTLPKGSGMLSQLDGEIVLGAFESVFQVDFERPVGSKERRRFVRQPRFDSMLANTGYRVDTVDRLAADRFVFDAEEALGLVSYSKGVWRYDTCPFLGLSGSVFAVYPEDPIVWVARMGKLYRFDSTFAKHTHAGFDLVLRDVRAGHHQILYGRQSTVQSTMKFAPRRIEYSKSRSISFAYGAAYFQHADKIEYSFQLEGFDEHVSPWSRTTYKEYTNLAEGTYRFSVRAKNAFGVQSATSSFDFSVLPPWYRTFWAYIGFSVGLLLIVYYGVRFYSRVLLRSQKRLEETVRRRTLEVTQQKEELRLATRIAKREREAAVTANKAKSEFLANMSHEIRTPMNCIIGFSEMLMETGLVEEQIEYVTPISKSGEALLAIVNDILDFSKIEAGELSFHTSDFSPAAVAFDICNLLVPRIGAKPIEVLCHVASTLPAFINSDASRFRQIVVNLLGNAVKFTSEGEIEISLSVGQQENERLEIIVDVRDTGIGIPAEQLDRIFDMFKQANPGSGDRDGTGLGLSICKKIAELMNGRIWVESVLGEGSVFHFSAWVNRCETSVESEQDAGSLLGKRALVYEKNIRARQIMEELLGQLEVSFQCVESPADLLASLTNQKAFDFIMVDIGVEDAILDHLVANVKAPRKLIGVFSTYNRKHRIGREKGFHGFLSKPLQSDVVMKMLLNLSIPAEEKIISTRQEETQEDPGNLGSILLAEDNFINQKLISYMISKEGYNVKVVDTGLKAVEELCSAANHYQLVFMDVQMPEMDGREATRIIRAKGLDRIPIIAMTAESMLGDRQKCIAAGMNDYISKPIERSVFNALLKKWVKNPDPGHLLQ
jgi:signal transduction histidine kinase/DNA-binding response OmpR family regulator